MGGRSGSWRVQAFFDGVWDFVTVMCLACAYGLWRGRLPERVAAVSFLLAWLASYVMHTRDFTRPQFGMFWVDVILMVILVSLALLSGRRWLMVACACHVLTLGDHFAMMIDMRILSRAYISVMAIWGYAVLLSLALGTWLEAEPERRRLRQASPGGAH